MTPARVLIADDHEIFRTGLRQALSGAPGIDIVGEAATGTEAVEQCERLKPDVLVLDLHMPQMNGMQVVETLNARGLRPRILVLSAFDDAPYVEAMQRLGVSGYVPKSRPPSTIQIAIQAVAEGGSMWYVSASANPLTDREREVLVLLARGHSNAEIAAVLHLGEPTVRNTLTAVYQKIGVSNARAAAAWAWANRLVNPDDPADA